MSMTELTGEERFMHSARTCLIFPHVKIFQCVFLSFLAKFKIDIRGIFSRIAYHSGYDSSFSYGQFPPALSMLTTRTATRWK